MKRKYLFLMRAGESGGAERLQIDYFKHIDFNKARITGDVIFIPQAKWTKA